MLEILKFPDSRLRNKCAPVKELTPDLLQLADDMLETMYQAQGLGLSAIQVNRFQRLLTADTRTLDSNSRYVDAEAGEYEKLVPQPVILFNPEIIGQKGSVVFKEGCLSFPSYYAEVKRSSQVEIKGMDKEGRSITFKTDGLLAICIQHEIDHLDGKLFIDHLSPIKAANLRAQIKKYGYPDSTVDSPHQKESL